MIRFCFALRRLLTVFKMSAVKRKLKNTKILKHNLYLDKEQGKTAQRARTKLL